MKFYSVVLLLFGLATVHADIFIRLENVPTFETNTTKLCDVVLEVESPPTNRVGFCNNTSNYEVYTVWYSITGVKLKNVTGRGFRITPTEINANLTRIGFFKDPNGKVVVVMNYWKNDFLVIMLLLVFVIFFTILGLSVAVSTL